MEGLFTPALRGHRVIVTSTRLHADVSTDLGGRPLECCRLFILIVSGSVCAGHFFVPSYHSHNLASGHSPSFPSLFKCFNLSPRCLLLLQLTVEPWSGSFSVCTTVFYGFISLSAEVVTSLDATCRVIVRIQAAVVNVTMTDSLQASAGYLWAFWHALTALPTVINDWAEVNSQLAWVTLKGMLTMLCIRCH